MVFTANSGARDKYGISQGRTLQVIGLGGHVIVLRLLIDKGAEVNAQKGQLGSALQAASEE